MNAPYPPAVLRAEAQRRESAPADPWTILPDAVRLSSRPLKWRYLHVERREVEPGSHDLPGGTTHHLLFVSLADGHCIRASDDELTETEFEAGHVSSHPAFKPVRWKWDMRLSFAVLCLESDFLVRVAEEVFDLQSSQLRLKAVESQRDPLVTQIAGLLSREALNSDSGSPLVAKSMAMQLAVHLIRHYSERPQPAAAGQSPPRAVLLASDFIRDNYSRDISLGDIADAAHLSPFHLARLFKKTTGMTPHQYLVDVKVNSARSLLTAGAGSRSLAEVAAAVGFSDQSHLTRHFKRALGLTPRQLKQ
jgi:AraC family transcriptional regulator